MARTRRAWRSVLAVGAAVVVAGAALPGAAGAAPAGAAPAAVAPAAVAPAAVAPAAVPKAPGRVWAVPGSNQATVHWAASADAATGYVVQKSLNRSTWSTVVGSPTAAAARTLTAYRLNNRRPHWFRVAAVGADGQGPWSAPSAPVTPREQVPGRVATLTGTSPARGTVVIRWTPPASGYAPTSYQVRSRRGFGTATGWTDLPVTARSYTFRGLASGADYLLTVRGVRVSDVGTTRVVWVRVR